MASAGTLTVGIRARTARFNRDMKRAGQTVSKFSASLAAVSIGAAAAVTAVIAVGKAVSDMTFRVARSVDEMAKFAGRIGTTTENLSALEFSAKLTGVQVNQLRMGLQRMTRRVSEAAAGTGEAQDAIKELGLDATELNRLDPARQFEEIAEAIRLVQNPTDQLRLAFKLFDSEGTALINTLRLGRAQLRANAREARELGIVISRDTARSMEDMNDSVTRLDSALEGLKIEIAEIAGPVIEHAAAGFTIMAKRIRDVTTNSRIWFKAWRTGFNEIRKFFGLPGIPAVENFLAQQRGRGSGIGDMPVEEIRRVRAQAAGIGLGEGARGFLEDVAENRRTILAPIQDAFAGGAASNVTNTISSAISDGIFNGFRDTDEILQRFGQGLTETVIESLTRALVGEPTEQLFRSFFQSIVPGLAGGVGG